MAVNEQRYKKFKDAGFSHLASLALSDSTSDLFDFSDAEDVEALQGIVSALADTVADLTLRVEALEAT